jgi:hypothetical protein
MQALPRLRRREADTTSYVADYLTRSVRRASGFVLADHPGVIVWRSNRNVERGCSSVARHGATGSFEKHYPLPGTILGNPQQPVASELIGPLLDHYWC